MNDPNPELVALPFQATLREKGEYLNYEQVLAFWSRGKWAHLQIERSYPGAPHAIGWTIFRRTPKKYLHDGEPLFRFERGARKRLRQVYAIHYSLVGEHDALTHSHLHL
ncbi:MAG: hypothetical protein AB1649_27055 [Chloroflexota bacterium]